MAKDNEILLDILREEEALISKAAEVESESRQNFKKKLKEEQDANKKLEEERQKLRKYFAVEEAQQQLEDAKKLVKEAATLKDAKEAELLVKQKEQALKIEEAKKKNAEKIAKIYENAVGKLASLGGDLYNSVNKSVDAYSNYFEEMQTRLLGSGKTYNSVADMLSKTFSGSPFFAMKDVMEQTKTFIQQGITYNVELRASLQTISTKMAATFNALDATLLRLVRIQGDSTQARLGIESKLVNLFNSQFQDTSYLTSNINESVSASLLEAEARLGKIAGTEFEYEAQKWLGSLYSVGASQNLINQLASGLGALGSGDVTGLSANTSLTNLLALAASKGGGADLGDLITRGATASDVAALMTGLYSLVQEVSKTDNIVALKEYANVFGLSISDLKSVLNLTAEDIKTLTAQTLTYDESLKQVTSQLTASTLFSRTHISKVVDNLTQNMIDSVASGIAGSAAGYIGWKVAGAAAEFTKGLTVEAAPFGIGVSTNVGDITKSIATAAAFAASFDRLSNSLSNIGGVNLANLENSSFVSRGQIQDLTAGTKRSYAAFEGNMESSALYKQSVMSAQTEASKVTDEDFDKQKKETEKVSQRLQNIDDNVALMVKLLDTDGIVIRGRTGETTSFATQLAGIGGLYQG